MTVWHCPACGGPVARRSTWLFDCIDRACGFRFTAVQHHDPTEAVLAAKKAPPRVKPGLAEREAMDEIRLPG
jgi:hypothetical protein